MLQNFGTALSREQMKKVMGGLDGGNCGTTESGGCCNVYCGTGRGISCTGSCGTCSDAGNGRGSEPGQDKMCQTAD